MTPKPPYCAVIFTSQRTDDPDEEYVATAQRMATLAAEQPGFLGMESVRDNNGFGITVSYWQDEGAIKAWKAHEEHQAVQRLGKEKWYQNYTIRISGVERAYHFKKDINGCFR